MLKVQNECVWGEININNCSSVSAAAAVGMLVSNARGGGSDEELTGSALVLLGSELHKGCHHKA